MWLDDAFAGSFDRFQRRLKILILSSSAIYLVIGFRLFQLQVIGGRDMARLSKQNRTELVFFRASRGRILDRQGRVIVENRPSFTVFYAPEILTPEVRTQVESALAKVFEISREEMTFRISRGRKYRQMVRLWEDVPGRIALLLIERRADFPGTMVVTEPKRVHRYGTSASHLTGYVNEIDSNELAQKMFEGYKAGDYVGRAGVEKTMENYLRGQAGGFELEVDATGRYTKLSANTFEAKPGFDVVLTIDQKIQDAAESGLDASPTGMGACVVLNPWTGEVLALASHPGFKTDESVSPLLVDKRRPLFNRAISGTYPLGSVYKIITAAAALNKNRINTGTSFFCPGYFNLGTKTFNCWKTHGRVNFHEALVWSCDVYFFNTGLRVGPNALEEYARNFGMGKLTGIDLPGEVSGIAAGPTWKKRVFGQDWYDGDTVNVAIGQGYVSATPLQAARLIAAVANGGTLFKPYVTMKVIDRNGLIKKENRPEVTGKSELSGEVWDVLKEDLGQVVLRGTGQAANVPGIDVHGKTGTAQNPHGEDHAWFVAYAGRQGEQPQIAVAAIVEQGGHGGAVAAPVVQKVIAAAFDK